MQWYLVLVLLVVTVVVAEESSELPLAEPCDVEECKLPECRCSSTEIPGGLAPRDTPQFVLVTFDDAVTITNIDTYRDVLYNRLNSNGCPVGATFYISHEYTNYQAVNELYNRGFEMALHSISHRTPQTFWADASYDELKEEFADQMVQMAHFANIPYQEIHGLRIPFLQMSGNTSFQVMADYGLKYDSSRPTVSFRDPGLWPYTLHYASIQDCPVQPCPSASIPGPWVFPMVSWTDLMGFPCSMVDACFAFPDRTDDNAWFEFIVQNFERHYFGNRSPFGFYIHESYLAAYPAVRRALVRFLDTINNINDVFMVNTNEVLEWVKNPVPVNEYRRKDCRRFTQTTCRPTTCGPIVFGQTSYWMSICNVCPRQYPWVGNPLGQ